MSTWHVQPCGVCQLRVRLFIEKCNTRNIRESNVQDPNTKVPPCDFAHPICKVPCNHLTNTQQNARNALIYRPQVRLLHRRSMRSTSAPQGHVKHKSETYSKEVDATPLSDHTVHRLDPESDNVQKPHEPPSGYSRAGVETGEYSSVHQHTRVFRVDDINLCTVNEASFYISNRGFL